MIARVEPFQDPSACTNGEQASGVYPTCNADIQQGVQATRPHERRVQQVGPISGADHEQVAAVAAAAVAGLQTIVSLSAAAQRRGRSGLLHDTELGRRPQRMEP